MKTRKTEQDIISSANEGFELACKHSKEIFKGMKIKKEYRYKTPDDFEKAKEAAKNCNSDEFKDLCWAAYHAIIKNKKKRYEKI